MGHVFVSYSRHDQAYVARLVTHLQAQGITVWYDSEIQAGERWSERIKDAIESCTAMIVVMSPAAASSEMVENEIDLARSRGKRVLPLLLAGEPFFGLRHIQYTDVRDQAMPGPGFAALITGSTPATPPPVEPTLPREKQPFLLPIEDVFTIAGRGSVVTGRVERGELTTGSVVEIVGLRQSSLRAECSAIETFRKIVKSARPDEQVGLLLRDVGSQQIERGMVVAAPGSITAYRSFEAAIYLSVPGRDPSAPALDRARLRIWTAEVAGAVTAVAGGGTPRPDESTPVVVYLDMPVALAPGVRFEVREGEAVVGTGHVLRVLA